MEKKSSSSSSGKEEGVRDKSKKEKLFLAEKIDMKSIDEKLDKHLSKVWSKSLEMNPRAINKEEWEIDLTRLVTHNVIALGTYGTVYKGVYDGQAVAVKVLDWEGDGNETKAKTAANRALFHQEVTVWQKLNHPNVTKFVGAAMATTNMKIPSKDSKSLCLPQGVCCVVVEYLPGGTLKEFLIRHWSKKLAFKVVIKLVLDLSRGLSYLHSKKIVHRDVKTENMLLDDHKKLKIADFGVARVEALNPKDMTGETGSIRYMAPEVIDGKPYNRRCDVYSFGICLWETYCCDFPYHGFSFADIASRVVLQNMRPEIPRCCPTALANIMRKCWDANPERRPEMEEVVKMLEGIDTSRGGGMIPEDQNPGGCFCFIPARGP